VDALREREHQKGMGNPEDGREKIYHFERGVGNCGDGKILLPTVDIIFE
jgi:hypothetical protein